MIANAPAGRDMKMNTMITDRPHLERTSSTIDTSQHSTPVQYLYVNTKVIIRLEEKLG